MSGEKGVILIPMLEEGTETRLSPAGRSRAVVAALFILLFASAPALPGALAGERAPDEIRILTAALKKGDSVSVLSGCRGLIARDPSSIQAYRLLVKAAVASGRQDETESYLRGLAEREPAQPFYAYALGLGFRSRNTYLKAREAFEKALNLGLDSLDGFEDIIGPCQYKEDLAKLRSIIETRPGHGSSAPSLAALGLIAFRLSDYADARAHWEGALSRFRTEGDRKGEAWSLGRLSDSVYYLNAYATAIDLGEQAVRTAEEAGAPSVLIDSLYNLSFYTLSMGNYGRAEELARRARALSQEEGDSLRLHQAEMALANICLERGDLAGAGDLLERALAYFVAHDELFYRMKACFWLSAVLHEKGEYVNAMERAREALALSRQLGFRTGDVFHLSAMADICLSLGNAAKSLEYSREALAAAAGKVGKWSEEKCLNTIGYVHIRSGRNREALGYFLQALDFIRRIDHRREEAKCLYNVGVAYLRLGDRKGALEYFGQSLEEAARRGNRIIQAFCENGLADLALGAGAVKDASDHYQAALKLGLEMRHPGVSIDAYAGLGASRERSGETDAAVEAYRQAIGIIEDLRGRICFRDYSSGFFKSKIGVYEDLIALYERLHRASPDAGFDRECFYYAEKARARAFLDDMETAEVRMPSDGESQAAQNEIDILSHRINKIVTHLYSYDLEDSYRAALRSDLEKAEEELQAAWSVYNRPDGPLAGRLGQTYRCEDVQRLLLDDGTALVEYFVGERNVFIFLVTRSRFEVARRSPGEFQTTLIQAANYRNLMSTRDASGFHGLEAGARLYASLFRPLKSSLPASVKRIIVVPDGELYGLPFESLISGTGTAGPRFLLEDYDISYSPSASLLVRIMSVAPEPRQGMDLLAVGGPVFETARTASGRAPADVPARDDYQDGRFEIYPLKHAQDEIRGVSRYFSGARRRVIKGAAAREETVKGLSLKDYRIIHFATHSLLDEAVASRSALVLTLDSDPAEDGFLQAREIYELKLDCDLVVLSACQTARGLVEKGEGITGLSRAFFCAGARSVLASLWNIDDRSTRVFMERFYGYLVKGYRKNEALRLAKLGMLESEFAHPCHWAAFILIGESNSEIPCAAPSFADRVLGLF